MASPRLPQIPIGTETRNYTNRVQPLALLSACHSTPTIAAARIVW
jgi:hypothetical protein